MDEARDDMYCHLTARRSVATAALRLGLQRMSEEALDSVAGVLIGYVERIGETLAASVEASGRSSAHCHAWDALRAIEQCTEPAVWRMHLTDTTTANTTTTTTAAAGQQSAQSQQQQPTNGASVSGTAADDSLNNASSVTTTTTTNGEAAGTSATGGDNSNGAPTNTNNNSNQNGDHPSSKIMTDPAEVLSWKGLAAFCFGPQWSEPITEDELASMNMMMMNGAAAAAAATSDAPGKVGPSSLLLMMDTAAANNSINTSTTAASAADGRPGWHAPFPEEVPIFPVTHQRQTAHPVPPQLQSTADSLHPTPESLALQHSKQQTDIEDTTNAHAPDKDDNEDDLVDAIFQKSMWGQARPTPAHVGDKRTRGEEDPMDVDPEPPTKKSKTASATNKTTTDAMQVDSSDARDANDEDDDDEDAAHPSYVPHFFPPFPRRTDLVGPIVADDEEEDGDGNNPDDPTSRNSTTLASTSTQTDLAQTTTSINNSPEEDELCASSSLQVRSALVKLGRPWGAMETASTTTTAQDPRLVVPAGGEASNSSSSGNNTTAPIVPLNKPSGSRPCKIMEGSMDSFA